MENNSGTTFETFAVEGVTKVPDATLHHFSKAMFYRTEDGGDIVYLLREEHHTDYDVSSARTWGEAQASVHRLRRWNQEQEDTKTYKEETYHPII